MNNSRKVFIGTPFTLFSNTGKSISFTLPLETLDEYCQKVDNAKNISIEDFSKECNISNLNMMDFSHGEFLKIEGDFYVAISNTGMHYIFN